MFNKKTSIIFILTFFFFNINAQYSINADFTNGNMDNNISLMVEKSKKRNSFALGIKIHIKTPYLDDGQFHAFYRNSYATQLGDFIGFKFGYERCISPKKWKNLRLVTFENSYYSRFRTQLTPYNRNDPFRIFDRMNFLENNIGLGMKLKVIESVYINLKTGGGVMLIWDIDKTIGIRGGSHWTWAFCRLFSAGVSVKL
jgi:hypothetical protein